MQKHQQLQQLINEVLNPNCITPRHPLSLELIIAALERKEKKEKYSYYDGFIYNRTNPLSIIKIPFTPLQPLPQESVEKLLEIFK